MRDLHGKIFANYRRWCRHVNVQRFSVEGTEGEAEQQPERKFLPTLASVRASCRAAENPRASGGGGEDCALPLSALSGDVWEFRGVWAFESAAAELHWVTNAELHQLVLWYLIWGEAANLRLLPECLCLVLYCASNALNFEASNSEAGEAAAQRADGGLAEVTYEAGFAEKRLGLGLGLG